MSQPPVPTGFKMSMPARSRPLSAAASVFVVGAAAAPNRLPPVSAHQGTSAGAWGTSAESKETSATTGDAGSGAGEPGAVISSAPAPNIAAPPRPVATYFLAP